MRTSSLTREEALALLRNYNKEPFIFSTVLR